MPTGINLWKFNTWTPIQYGGHHFPGDIFKCIFSNENVWISIEISLKIVPKCPTNNIPALVQIMTWHQPGDKPLSEPMMVNLLTHICVTLPQWVKYRIKMFAMMCQENLLDFSLGIWQSFLQRVWLSFSPIPQSDRVQNLSVSTWLITTSYSHSHAQPVPLMCTEIPAVNVHHRNTKTLHFAILSTLVKSRTKSAVYNKHYYFLITRHSCKPGAGSSWWGRKSAVTLTLVVQMQLASSGYHVLHSLSAFSTLVEQQVYIYVYIYIYEGISVCVTIAFPNLYFLLVLIIVNFHHACYGEYLTIANFNVYYLLFVWMTYLLFVWMRVCVWERKFVSCYVMCFYLIVGQ